MDTTVIDIDQLLESTSDLTSETSGWIVQVEIDKLLERTKDWKAS